MSSWILVLITTLGSGNNITTGISNVENLKSLDECHRVEQVMKSFITKEASRTQEIKSMCMEVINK